MAAAARPPDAAARIAAIATRHGARLDGAPSSVTIGGRTFAVVDFDFANDVDAIAALNDFARDDATYGEEVRALARTLAPRYGVGELYARAIHAYVRDAIRFLLEDRQTFRSSDVTLIMRTGNCVNTARLVAALAIAGGVPARIVAVPDTDGEITHCAAQVFVSGSWQWAEGTVDACFGEEPRAAARRLGLDARDDLTR